MAADPDSPPLKLRIDKWLWQARFFKTRSLAAKAVSGGLRVNGTSVSKPAFAVGPGDVLTFTQARAVRVIRIAALGACGFCEETTQLAIVHSTTPPNNENERLP